MSVPPNSLRPGKHVSFADLKPRITVVGVGGAGGNAVNNMVRAKLEGVDFIVSNTDAQALGQSLAERRVQLGLSVTRGLGAGSKPEMGRAAAEEALEEVSELIKGSHMLFITAGMGGGTGTGAAPVIARVAREMGILTVGVVTKPFHFEGALRMRSADEGLGELQKYVDTLIVIPNQNLFRLATEKTTFADAFKMADDVLYAGVRGVTDLMIMPGLINLDFADVRSVMSEMGKAMMGTGEASGERRAVEAAEAAISNPLLDDVSMRGARGVLINITGGLDMTLFEVDEAANRIREEVDPEAQIIFGSTFDERLEGIMRVSVVATGIDGMRPIVGKEHESSSVSTPATSLKTSPSLNGFTGLAGSGSMPSFLVREAIPEETGLPLEPEKQENPSDYSLNTGLPEKAGRIEPGEPSPLERPSLPSAPQPFIEATGSRPTRRPSFFERLTGFTLTRTSSEEGVTMRLPEALTPANSSEALEDEELSIPAYLRRK